MGKPQYSYEYPEVRPPHSQVAYPAESQPVTNSTNHRFSWMDNTSEERNIQPGISSQTTKRQSTVPPLPNVPTHLNHDFQRQQQLVQDLPPLQMQSYPQTQFQHPQSTNPHTYASHSQQQQQYQYYQHQQNQQQYYHQQQQQQQQQQHLSEHDDRQQEYSRKPDPQKERPDHPNYKTSIAPDSNPLTPTSPQSPSYRKPIVRPQNTNISVMPPTPSRYNFTSYAPVPQPATGGTWTHGLCSCSEPSICMTALFCPCLLYGRSQYRLRQRSDKKDPTIMLGYKSVNGSCVGWSLLCGINGILTGIQKTRVRRSYEMAEESGNVFSDCLEGCCCCCCVLARNEKEIKYREQDGRRAAGEQGYVPPVGMTFAPPPR